MATFVLVHGAWGGAHGFRHVRRLLRAAGHEVSTPSLTGVGERIHLSSPMVNLTTHVRDVVNHVLYEDLSPIVLVGFSYGGFVVTGALEHIAERVAHLVYLDAFVPQHGDTAMAVARGVGRQPLALGVDWQTVGPPRSYDSPDEAAWMTPRRTTHPLSSLTEPVFLAQPLEAYPFTRTYIKATASAADDPGNDAFWRAARHAKASDAWSYAEIDSNHLVASNRPEDTARCLARAAGLPDPL
jgi:pimeloyl-ACP methyl ester carboxylesterase